MFRSGGGEGVAAKRQKITTTVDSALSSIDVVSHVASFLETNDLCQVKATCKALGSANDEFNGLSMAEEAARRIYEGASDEEKSLLPRYDGESWIELYYHLLMLRARLTFDQLVGHSVEYRGGDRAVVQVREFEGGYRICQAIGGNHIMRAGKHWATFSSTSRFDSEQTVGVIRPLPGWDKRGLVSSNPFSCYFYEEDGLEDVLAFRRDLQNERTDGWKGDVHLAASTWHPVSVSGLIGRRTKTRFYPGGRHLSFLESTQVPLGLRANGKVATVTTEIARCWACCLTLTMAHSRCINMVRDWELSKTDWRANTAGLQAFAMKVIYQFSEATTWTM